ncbi:MAG TPA: VWA domain-containing protein, partial [Schlesneria sp.]
VPKIAEHSLSDLNSYSVNQPADSIEEYNRLYKEQRFAEAEIVAKELKASNPGDGTAEALFWKARFARRKGSNDKLQLDKEESFWKQLDDVEQSVVVNVGDPHPMTFGDNWSDISKRRDLRFRADQLDSLVRPSKPSSGPTDSYSTSNGAPPPVALTKGESRLGEEARQKRNYLLPGLLTTTGTQHLGEAKHFELDVFDGTKLSSEAIKVTESLKKRISLHEDKISLGDAIRKIETVTEIDFDFDGDAMKEVDVTEAAPVTIDVDGIQAKSALNLILGRYDLAYTIDNKAVKITSRARQQSELAEHQRREAENEAYEAPPENAFLTPGQQPLSTFSIDVDSASYSNIRRFLTQGQRPPADAVRVEEMVNYFSYNYPQPKDGEPFSVTADAAPCPWQPKNFLARIGLQARTIDKAKRPPTNLVFLLDVSGSMQAANKLPLVKQAMTMLCEELNERDRIAIVTYAGDAGVKLASTPGSDQTRIMQSIEALQSGGSTNGAAGINLAYEEALRHFNGEGENRVILCTDGDFNVGVSSDDQLVELIQQQAKTKVFLSIFGFGMGNLKDAKLEKLADKGNGHYGYIDDLKEARRVFNEELVGTLYTVAKDVKIQVEFNPLTVGAYRLIGYENRALAAKDFNDDTKDAGEIGAGHTVTALYEIAPKGQWPVTQEIDPLKYGTNAKEAVPVETARKKELSPESADDLFTVKLRYKQPTADVSVKTIDYVVDDISTKKIVPSPDLIWAASVASFGMQLRNSQFKGNWTLNDVYEAAQGAKGADANGRRREFLDLVQAAKRLTPSTKQ